VLGARRPVQVQGRGRVLRARRPRGRGRLRAAEVAERSGAVPGREEEVQPGDEQVRVRGCGEAVDRGVRRRGQRLRRGGGQGGEPVRSGEGMRAGAVRVGMQAGRVPVSDGAGVRGRVLHHAGRRGWVIRKFRTGRRVGNERRRREQRRREQRWWKQCRWEQRWWKQRQWEQRWWKQRRWKQHRWEQRRREQCWRDEHRWDERRWGERGERDGARDGSGECVGGRRLRLPGPGVFAVLRGGRAGVAAGGGSGVAPATALNGAGLRQGDEGLVPQIPPGLVVSAAERPDP
jgi:hypothetical protein